ncbi:MAG: chemotaxis protein CheX [Gammaproteobacteria bacterium]|nr:chemotaxis protein CheX [Gammaproteobacteria bacterium]
MSITYTTLEALQEEERDALQELMNLATGRAGDALARVLKTFVQLSVPHVRLVPVYAADSAIKDAVQMPGEFSAARQSFHGGIDGEAIVIFDERGCQNLWDLLGHETPPSDSATRNELLMEVANILVGALVCSLGEQLGAEVQFTAPSFLAQGSDLGDLLVAKNLEWAYSLLIKIAFSVEGREFYSNVIVMFTEETVTKLRDYVRSLLGD